MSDYWLGVLSLPALVLAVGALWLAIKAVGFAGDRLLTGGLIHMTTASPAARRAAVASVVYGSKRAWMFAPGDIAVIVLVGLDQDEMRAAADRLQPRVSLRDFPTPAAPPPDAGEVGAGAS